MKTDKEKEVWIKFNDWVEHILAQEKKNKRFNHKKKKFKNKGNPGKKNIPNAKINYVFFPNHIVE